MDTGIVSHDNNVFEATVSKNQENLCHYEVRVDLKRPNLYSDKNGQMVVHKDNFKKDME